MNYTLSDCFGYKIHFYSLTSVFDFIERNYLSGKRNPKFFFYDFFTYVGSSHSPFVSSGGFGYKNTEARIWDNFTYSYQHDCYVYGSYYRLATKNLYVLTDIHGYPLDMTDVKERYYARCCEKYNLKHKRQRPKGIYRSGGYKHAKNQARILTRRYKCVELKNEYANSIPKDEFEFCAPVRLKRLSKVKSTIIRDYDYYVDSSSNCKSWKEKKKRKQWCK